MQTDSAYFKSALNAAKTRTYRAAVSARLCTADREDLHQELILDLLERAGQFDPIKGSAGTFTGVVSEHRTADFLREMKKDHFRLTFCCPNEAANDEQMDAGPDPFAENVTPIWSDDQDLFADSMALRDLQKALDYMNDDQVTLFNLLESTQNTPEACKASGMSSATFYRRVHELQMHLRMFGFRAAA